MGGRGSSSATARNANQAPTNSPINADNNPFVDENGIPYAMPQVGSKNAIASGISKAHHDGTNIHERGAYRALLEYSNASGATSGPELTYDSWNEEGTIGGYRYTVTSGLPSWMGKVADRSEVGDKVTSTSGLRFLGQSFIVGDKHQVYVGTEVKGEGDNAQLLAIFQSRDAKNGGSSHRLYTRVPVSKNGRLGAGVYELKGYRDLWEKY